MLPFLEPRKMTSIIIARHGKRDLEGYPEMPAPDGSSSEEDRLDPDFKEAAADVMRAFESRSVIDLARALHAAFQLFDSSPHEEGEHEEDEE
jgi:hypothetical protein